MADYQHEDPRAILARHGLSPKASMSQNFLVSERAVRMIVAATEAKPGELVVELGPGLGTLTAALMATGARIVAIERDPDMIRVLQAELEPRGLRVQRGDAADVDYAPFAAESGSKVTVVGNLPYAVTGAIIRNLTEARPHIARAVLMVQKEVRDRLVAQPDTSEYGALTVFVAAGFAVETVLRLPPSAFHPQPKVHSAVIKLVPHARPRAEETLAFRTVVKSAFGQRRKTLRNALGSAVGAAVASAALEHAGIDGKRRGETLSVEELATLGRSVEAVSG